MELTRIEWALDEIIPKLEAEHDAEPDPLIREAIWRLLSAAEEYLLTRDDLRRKA